MGCCCNGTCNKCGASGSGTFGSTFSLNISGVTVPTGCLIVSATVSSDCGGGPGGKGVVIFYRFTSLPINGTFCLTKDPNSCTWSVTVPVVVDVWLNPQALLTPGPCPAYGNPVQTFTQLQIIARPIFVPGTGAQVSVQAVVIDASNFWSGELATVGISTLNPFEVFGANFGIMDCLGTTTVTNGENWWSEYRTDYFRQNGVDCSLFSLLLPSSSGTPWGGTGVLADAVC